MAIFHYQAINAAGQQLEADVEAPTADAAIGIIKAQGHFPLRVKSAPQQLINRSSRGRKRFDNITFGRISSRAIAEFTEQLSTLQDAGLPIVRSLKILGQQEKSGPLKNVLAKVATSEEEGATLSDAMAMHPRAFNRLYVNMVRAGETGGVLDVILQRLAEFMEKAQRLRRRIIGAMIYPAVVISFSVLIVMGIMMFVVPKFQDIFRDFKTTLPAITTYLIHTADFYRAPAWVAAGAGPAGGDLDAFQDAREKQKRAVVDRFAQAAPAGIWQNQQPGGGSRDFRGPWGRSWRRAYRSLMR